MRNKKKLKIEELINFYGVDLVSSVKQKLNNTNCVKQILWHIENCDAPVPRCRTCNGPIRFRASEFKYSVYCCTNCRMSDPDKHTYLNDIQQRRQQTMLNRYGVENISHLSDFRKKAQNTTLERYGVRHAFQSSEIRAKSTKTLLERYGVENISHLSETRMKAIKTIEVRHGLKNVRKKAEQTMLNRYGVDNASKIPEFRHKAKQTMLDKYGVEHIMQSAEFKEKAKNTNLIRFGETSPSKTDIIKQKVKETSQVKFNRDYNSQIHISINTLLILDNKELFSSFIKTKSVSDICDALGVSRSTICKTISQYQLWHLIDNTENSYETIISQILTRLNIDYVLHDRTILRGKELDFYIPTHRLAIEVGNTYYHSEEYGRDRGYHISKWAECKSQKITLLQYFEQDLKKLHLIESKISRLVGIPAIIVGARKCEMNYVSVSDERAFLEKYHLQGPQLKRNWVLGAYYDNQLIAIMTIYHKNGRASLERWATNTIYSFPGLFSRMLAQFKRRTLFTGELTTYSNNRYGNGKVYESSGFITTGTTGAGFQYLKNNILESRQKYQYHKLLKLFNLGSEYWKSTTGKQIMIDSGYTRVWDAGHTRWSKHI